MSTARVLPWPERGRSSKLATKQPRLFYWFPWWIAFCMMVVAYNAQLQSQIQHRLLNASQELERAVAQSRLIAVQTNLQLQKVAELHRSTTHLDSRLERLGQINTRLKADLVGLGQLADAIQRSLVGVETQTADSQLLLQEIMRESDKLNRTLVDSRRMGEQVSTRLSALVGIQERINGDLTTINHKTRFLNGR